MGKRLPLRPPLPTIEASRKRLGGRGSTDARAGSVVTVRLQSGLEKDGVVVFASGDELDVWVAEDTVLRTTSARVKPVAGAHGRDIGAVAADARAFASLEEGRRVRYVANDGSSHEATLLEKCRWGALLGCDDGTIVAVGFRRVWSAAGLTN